MDLVTQEKKHFYEVKILNPRKKEVILLAIHAGSIEPGTGELVTELAGKDFSAYFFIGKKQINCFTLHLTSRNFDDPLAIKMVKSSSLALSFHGRKEEGSYVCIGGSHLALKKRCYDYLSAFSEVL